MYKVIFRTVLSGFLLLGMVCPMSHAADRPIVIAHRGASGYLPEHTLAAKAAAHAYGVDFIEQDVVLSKDGIPVVLHDIHLDTVTNVADVFPGRKRKDGRFYAIDFTVEEIRTLQAHERRNHKTGEAVFPKRFPLSGSSFFVPTLEEEIQLIQGMNRSTGRNVGIYPELKQPGFHHDEGKDLAVAVLRVLKAHGYAKPADKCFVQCFDRKETRRLRTELKCELPLIQLVTDKPVVTDDDMRAIAEYAVGIGPPMKLLVETSSGSAKPSDFASRAKAAGLAVHTWTLRADQIPDYAKDFAALHTLMQRDVKIDGAFSDFPDQTLRLFGN